MDLDYGALEKGPVGGRSYKGGNEKNGRTLAGKWEEG